MAGWSKGPTVKIKKPKFQPTLRVDKSGKVKKAKQRS